MGDEDGEAGGKHRTLNIEQLTLKGKKKMEYLGMNAMGMVPYEVPGIVGYYTLRVPHGDGVFQVDIRKMPEEASHTMPPVEARAAERGEAACVMSRMFIACMAAGVNQ